MGANLSFERPKCRYPNPNNKTNQVGPMIVNDPYKNKRGLNMNVSSLLGPQTSGLSSMLKEGMMMQNPTHSLSEELNAGNSLLKEGIHTIISSSPQINKFLSELSKRNPEELKFIAKKIAGPMQYMSDKDVSKWVSIASPFLLKLSPEQFKAFSENMGPTFKEALEKLKENNFIPPPPTNAPPPLPQEYLGGSKNIKVNDLRQLCKKHHIQITKNGKYLTKKELLKIIQKKKLY